MKGFRRVLIFSLAIPLTAFAGEEALELSPSGRIAFAPIRESSGLIESRRHSGVIWTHNDSGDDARIFAIRPDGSLILPEGTETAAYQGIAVTGAKNRDWEDIAIDGQGNLYIGEIGNNGNRRQNLGVYIVPEPDPLEASATEPAQFIPFRYPDQEGFPPEKMNFDSEALVYAGDSLYLLTKHRSDSETKLYRFPSLQPQEEPHVLELLGSFDIGGMVTGADVSLDGRNLVVVTYDAVWVFQAGEVGAWLEGEIRYRKIQNADAAEDAEYRNHGGEAVAWVEGKILVGNEGRDLFLVDPGSMVPFDPKK